jgi:hypothetical protein
MTYNKGSMCNEVGTISSSQLSHMKLNLRTAHPAALSDQIDIYLGGRHQLSSLAAIIYLRALPSQQTSKFQTFVGTWLIP